MHDAVTVHMDAEPAEVWGLVSDITNTGKFSPETFEAEWLGDADGPAVGVRFRGHVKRNGRGPTYWTICEITECEPGQDFGFKVLGPGERSLNSWRYQFAAGTGGGTDVTESFRLADTLPTRMYWMIAGRFRGKTNRDGMQTTLERIKAVVEAEA